MAPRTNLYSGAPWEAVAGYCRAVQVGSHIMVSGTAPVGADGKVVAKGDIYRQARRCIEIISDVLSKADAGLEDVVRTRMYVTDISRWADVARAHKEAFGDISPATTMVEVSGLIDPDMLVEIEADAVLERD